MTVEEEQRWYVSCGCDTHGDHLGCNKLCSRYGCVHPIGVEVTAATPEESDTRSEQPVQWDDLQDLNLQTLKAMNRRAERQEDKWRKRRRAVEKELEGR